MSTNLVVNGTSYAYPAVGDQNWGANASAWAAAVTSGMLQKAGGTFTLTAAANFGPSFGLQALSLQSVAASPALTGVLQLANLDGVNWRNAANTADLSLTVNASNLLQFNGNPLVSGGGGAGSIVNSDISASAAIAYSKLNLSGNVQNSDISATAAIAYSKLNLSGNVQNSDISTSAGIQLSKLAVMVTGTLVGNNTGSSASPAAVTMTNVATAGTVVYRDTNGNAQFVNVIDGFTTTATAAGTTTLAAFSNAVQEFTGTTTQTLVLPNATTLSVGLQFTVLNRSTGAVTVQANGGSTLQTMQGGSQCQLICTSVGTSAGAWDISYVPNVQPVALGGTGQTAAVSAPAASAWAGWDANKNLTASSVIEQLTSTATAAGTTTLTVASTQNQVFTGTTTQTVVLPVATTLAAGQSFIITNLSTGVVTVQTSGLNTVMAMPANSQLIARVVNTAGGTGTASWAWASTNAQTPAPAKAPTNQVFYGGLYYTFTVTSANATAGATYTNNGYTFNVRYTIAAGTTLVCNVVGGVGAPTASGTLAKASGTGDASIVFTSEVANGTYFAPTNPSPLYIRVRMAGGGGGGGGSGTAAGSGSVGGAQSTFGSSYLTAGGGTGGGFGGIGGVGGGATNLAGTGGIVLAGGYGAGSSTTSVATGDLGGAMGGSNPLGGAGGGGAFSTSSAGTAGATGTGGGGGAGIPNPSGTQYYTGAGGGAGAYIDTVIPNPAASYVFVSGGGGVGGTAGTSGYAGGAGGSGIINIDEYYQ